MGLRDISIKTKLILLTTVCSGLALLMTSIGFVIQNVGSAKSSKVEQLHSQAEMLAFNSTAILTFQDDRAAKNLLASLQSEPSVEWACLYDAQGKVLASYRQKAAPDRQRPTRIFEGYEFQDDGTLWLFQDVIDEGEKVGSVFIQANLHDLDEKMLGYLKVIALVAIGSLALAIALSLALQRRISGPIIELSQTAEMITSSDDYSIRVSSGARDELGTLYVSFNQMLDQVERSRTALKGAVANMSHEIRTPINAILGFTELLRDGGAEGDSEAWDEYLATIHTSGQHLLNLINDVLDLSKIEAGQIDFEREACSPHAVIADVVSFLRMRAIDNGIDLKYEWQSQVPESITTDSARLRQLLINLVNNAIKFTEKGEVRLTARLELQQGVSQLVVDVHDSGIGIAPEKLDSIFDPFVQADSTVTRRFGGTGLGLSISRRIAVALGGELTVTSEEGRGSTFTVRIDAGCLDGVRLIDRTAIDATVTAAAEKPSGERVTLPGINVLVVDDGETNRKLIRLILGRAGARVASAENGAIAIEEAHAQPFDVILMDMQMPVMDGYTATQQLRGEGWNRPIIALTAHAMKDDQAKCLAAGCSGYLTKPIYGPLLLSTIRDALGETDLPLDTEQASPSDALIGAEIRPMGFGSVDEELIHSELPTDDPDFYEIVAEFIEKLHTEITAMTQASQAGDLESVARIAHWIKGSGGTVGFPQLTDLARELEGHSKDGDDAKIIKALDEFKHLANRLSPAPATVAT